MTSASYEFTARAKSQRDRPRLMSVWALTGFAVLVTIPLTIAFMKEDLLLQAERERLGDSLSVSYLTNLLRTEPENLELRVWLAENKIYLGELADIPALIEPVIRSTDPNWQTKGLLAMYKYVTKQYALSTRDPSARAALMKRRHVLFTQLAARPLPAQVVVYLAGQASKLHEHDIGVRLYKRITESSNISAAWCADTAKKELGDGDYQLAAFLYFTARHKDHALQKQREYFIAGIRTLMANSMYQQAMQAADQHLGNLADDADTLSFLVQVARAANDQGRAAGYVRRLLQISWLERAYVWLRHLDVTPNLIATATAAPVMQAQADKAVTARYDPKKYKLAYDVFLENRNLADAFRVAESAVRQSPRDAAWHKRLAQVAGWINKPRIALREWLWLLRHKGGEEALLAVLRLAPALDDYEATLEAWRYRAAQHALTAEQLHTVADLFEKTGRQDEGIRFFETRYEHEHVPALLEIAATLAQRNGDEEHAQSLYLRLLKSHGFNSNWVQGAATVYLQKGQYKKAYELLKKNAGHADKKDAAYWKLLADLAWELQHDVDAAKDYRELAASGSLAQEDISRLISLLGESKQEEIASLAELAYRKYGDRTMLFRALEIHAARHDLVAEKRLFDSVAADPKADFSRDAQFLLLRAQYLEATGAFQEARTSFHHAISLAPDDPDTITSALWFLVEAHDQTALRALTTQIIARGDQQNPAYWGALAAAYDVLDEPARSVAYYSRQIKQYGQDFLWLVNYAEALERNREPGLALRVRQQAWSQLRRKLHGQQMTLPFSPDMLAAARLEIVNQPGDPSLALVRSVLRQDRLIKHDVAMDTQLGELVLGWALSNEQVSNAKAWLWQRYGRSITRPLWADATIAVAEDDTQHLGSLLTDQADWLPIAARHDAAVAVGQASYAQSIAFDALSADPDNESAYENFRKDALATAGYVDLDLRNQTFGTMHSSVQRVRIESALSDTFRLAFELQHTYQSDVSPPALSPYPSNEKLAGVGAKSHSNLGDTEVAIRRLSEFGKYTEVQASQKMSILPDLTLRVGAQVDGAADESNSLRVFGMRDAVTAAVDYTFANRAYVSLQPQYARYYTQKGNALGRGHAWSWEIGQHVSTSYPELRVALIGISEAFGTDRFAAFAMPPTQDLYGACFGFTDDYPPAYSRAWNPYFDACGTHNNVSGKGYIAKVGAAGPLAGHDRLNLSFDQEQGGVKVVNGLERIMRLNYRYFFD